MKIYIVRWNDRAASFTNPTSAMRLRDALLLSKVMAYLDVRAC